jgi:UDP-glucuronate 4-epimerase
MKRDFTYIDDIIEGTIRVMNKIPVPSPVPCKIYNIGYGKPVDLMTFIGLIEKNTGKTALKELLPMQAGDVPVTWAGIGELEADTGYRPLTDIEAGVPKFVEWFYDYNAKK